MSQIKEGTVVRLKSGGPMMTVEWVENDVAYCSWFDGAKKDGARFPLATIEVVEPA